MNLLPRDEKFYAFFLKQVEIISQAARVLLEGVRIGNSRLAGAATEISVLENRGDEVIHSIFTPPQPDLHHAARPRGHPQHLERAGQRAGRHRRHGAPPGVVRNRPDSARHGGTGGHRECLRRLGEEARSKRWQQKGPILEHCIEINRLENEADLISRSAVADLFRKQKDPITLIKLKEVYEFFENTIDRFEDVADVLQNVVVKNS